MDKTKRIVVVGTSCSGKTTLVRQISQILNITYIELDFLFWGPNWTPSPRDKFRTAVKKATTKETWVADGNYSVVRDIVWKRATTLIWLNYSFFTVYKRALRRTIQRIITQQEMYS